LHGVVFDILVGSENHVGSAVPVPQPGAVRNPMIHTRCPFVFDRCRTEEPQLRSTEGNQWVACHLEALPEEQDPLGDARQALPVSTPVE